VFNVFVHWVDKFWFDFSKDCPQLSNKLKAWLENCKDHAALSTSAIRLEKKLQKWVRVPKVIFTIYLLHKGRGNRSAYCRGGTQSANPQKIKKPQLPMVGNRRCRDR
jgi:hypothetical protein